jgi:hypothetical protein
MDLVDPGFLDGGFEDRRHFQWFGRHGRRYDADYHSNDKKQRCRPESVCHPAKSLPSVSFLFPFAVCFF